MPNIKVSQKREGSLLKVQVSGYVGENAEIFEIKLDGITDLDIDLDGVNYLNSVGIKNWILWTRKFSSALRVIFRNCPSLVVNQMNMVVDFLPRGAGVQSFYVPYHCDGCATDKAVLVTEGQEYSFATASTPRRVDVPESIPCPKCGAAMELDVIPDKFFSFLNYRPPE